MTVCMAAAKSRDEEGIAFEDTISAHVLSQKELRKPCYRAIINLVEYCFRRSRIDDHWKTILKAVLSVSWFLLYSMLYAKLPLHSGLKGGSAC